MERQVIHVIALTQNRLAAMLPYAARQGSALFDPIASQSPTADRGALAPCAATNIMGQCLQHDGGNVWLRAPSFSDRCAITTGKKKATADETQ